MVGYEPMGNSYKEIKQLIPLLTLLAIKSFLFQWGKWLSALLFQ